jgi:type 2 lantibiotic biosynthesis protein LanM
MWSSQFSQQLVRNCEFLFERLGESGVLDPQEPIEFERWRRIFDFGAESHFERRLRSLSLNVDQAKGVFGQHRAGSEIPAWCQLLQKAVEYEPPADAFPNNFPFSPLWWPIVAYAQEQAWQSPENRRLMSPGAYESLASQLLQDICKLAAEPSYRLFAQERAKGQSFQEFVRISHGLEYINIFEAFPALARSIAILVSNWIQTTAIFLSRLRADLSGLGGLLGPANTLLPVQRIKAGLSDRHEGGFQAIFLEFSGGARVVYKPKDMSLEAALPTVNHWLESEGSSLRFRFPRSLVKESYGWAEFIDQSPCGSMEEVERYCYQAGALLCLAYILNTRDLLVDNLVACGPDPVPIDLEAFFQPEMQRVTNYGKRPESEVPEHRRKSSVIDTGLLPIWLISGIDAICDLSGLSGNKELIVGLSRLGWQEVNSDRMQPIQEAVTAEPAQNKVYHDGIEQKVTEHPHQVTRGFSDLYHLIVSRKQSLVRFLTTFHSARSRVIFRSTSVYSKLIKESTQPDALLSGMSRSLIFERLFRPMLKSHDLSSHTKKLLDFEVERLSLLDIPRIYADLDATGIQLEDRGTVPNALWEPPLTTVTKRAETLSATDLDYHLENIQAALSRKPVREKQPLTEDRRLEMAVQCAESILNEMDDSLGDFLWRLPSFCSDEQIPAIHRIGVYTGDLGVLIFLTAMNQLHTLPQLPSLEDRYLARRQGSTPGTDAELGICNGSGSLIYGSILLSNLTGNGRWQELSERIASSVTESAIQECQEPDITSGLAGLLIALVALYEATNEQLWLDLSRFCAETLRERFSAGRGWVRPNGDCPLGLAHGTAGVAFAGIRYARASGEEIGIELANDAFGVDRQFYSPQERNWPVMASHGSSFMTTWCAGLPGVLLARAYAWQVTHDDRLLGEVQNGLKNFPSLLGTDHWCCGNLGNAEILLSLAQILGQLESRDRSIELMEKVIHRASKCAFYRFSPNLGENYCFQPSLFRGSAGVGYTILRSLYPAQFPSIIGFEIAGTTASPDRQRDRAV